MNTEPNFLKRIIEDRINKIKMTNINEFPLHIYPEPIQDFLLGVRNELKLPIEFVASNIFSVFATCIGGKVSLDNGSFIVRPIFWIVTVGDSGTGKSPALAFSLKSLKNKDNKAYEHYKIEKINYDNQQAGNQLSSINKPIFKKLVYGDITPEAIDKACETNENGFLLESEEFIKLIMDFNRYSKGGTQQMFLSLWNGGGKSVDRKNSDPIHIANTNINIIGTTQFDILNELSKGNRKADGFIYRILYALDTGTTTNRFTGKRLDDKDHQSYLAIVDKLIELDGMQLKVSEEAKKYYIDWQDEAYQKCYDSEQKSIQAKLDVYVWRFSLVLHLLHELCADKTSIASNPSPIVREEMLKKAIQLAEYFRKNAYEVGNILEKADPLGRLSEKERTIYHNLPETDFKRKDVMYVFEKFGIKVSNAGFIHRFLNDKGLFKKKGTGHYQKIHYE